MKESETAPVQRVETTSHPHDCLLADAVAVVAPVSAAIKRRIVWGHYIDVCIISEEISARGNWQLLSFVLRTKQKRTNALLHPTQKSSVC